MTSSDITNSTDGSTLPALDASMTPAAAQPAPVSTPALAKTPATKAPASVKAVRKTVRRAPVKKVAEAPAAAPSAAPLTAVAAKRSAAKPTPVAAKAADKPLAKPPVKKPVKAKSTAQTPAKSTTKAAAEKTPAEKASKLKKPKLVRDSFTIPKSEYSVLDDLKQRSITIANPAKKSELLRAGIKALAAMTDAAFKSALAAVPTIKTGRPSKN